MVFSRHLLTSAIHTHTTRELSHRKAFSRGSFISCVRARRKNYAKTKIFPPFLFPPFSPFFRFTVRTEYANIGRATNASGVRSFWNLTSLLVSRRPRATNWASNCVTAAQRPSGGIDQAPQVHLGSIANSLATREGVSRPLGFNRSASAP